MKPKLAIFQSIPEALMYFLLIFVLITSIFGDLEVYSIINQHTNLLNEDKNDTMEIEQQQKCIAAFFLIPNRAGLTLSNVGVCSDILKGIDQTQLK